ncbi:MAG: HAMP domain-containing protein [Proteobacteria bacterium]|nr:HAMP domain-containing protein [Pseudomonadota bacterium]MBI3495691.1 HAMP domain-containing protein [Pseudomonadota bacterium]
MLKLHSLRTRLVAIIALIVVLVCAGLAALFLPQQEQLTRLALDREMRAQYQSVLAAVDYERKTVLALATFAASLPEVPGAFAASDRDRLVAELGGGQKAIAQAFGYDLMTLSRPPATVVVRVHSPATFGDDLQARRKMVVGVLEDGKPRSGIEPGLTAMSIFGTVPLMQADKQIGAYDVGMSIGKPFVDAIKARFGIDIAVHLADGKEFKTIISTLPNSTVGTAAEYAAAFAGAPVIRRAAVDGNAVAAYFGQLRDFSGTPIAVVEVVKNIADFEAIAGKTRNYLIGATLAVLAVAVPVALFLAFGLARPIARMTQAMNRLSGGDTATDIPGRKRKDEIGEMAVAVQVFKDEMLESEQLRAGQEAMKIRAEAEKKAALEAIADRFEASVKGVVEGVSTAASQMQSSAQSMSSTAEETSRQAVAVAAASEEASTNVQTVASAAEELSSSIAEIGRQVSQSTEIAGQAVDEVGRTNTQVQGLSEAAQKIGEIVGLINDIAGQTSLLALNATIEAARAGEAGKGFAVVASEVKSLATQTARATGDIAAQVNAIQTATGDAVKAIQGISGTISQISEIATQIASAVHEQGAATQEIARNVQQASAGTNEVSANITGVTKAAGETGASAAQVLGAAGALSKEADRLSSEVEGFLGQIRAA